MLSHTECFPLLLPKIYVALLKSTPTFQNPSSKKAEVDQVSKCIVRHLAKWKNNSLQDRDRHIFLSASKLYPASCLMNEECYLGDKKSACAYRRGLLWGLCQREPRGSPRCLPTSVSGGETLDPADNSLMLFRNGTSFSNVYIYILWLLFPM